jgi:hypothetical protein
MPEEGDIDEARGDRIAARFHQLSDDDRAWIGERVQEANAADLPIRVKEQPTRRRCAIAETLITHRESGRPDKALHDLIGVVLDEPDIHVVPLGAAIAVCDAHKASALLSFTEMGATVDTNR